MTQTWQSLGWTLLHFLWQGAAIALLYWIADRLCARRGANLRYAIALAALLAMPLAAVVTLLREQASAAEPTPQIMARAAATFTTDILLAPSDVARTAPTASFQRSARAVLNEALPWLDAVWLAGVFFFSLRALGGWWLLRRLRLIAQEQAPHTLRLHLDALRRRMGIGRFVDLRLSRRIINPLTAGVLKPWILLPISALTALSPEQLEVVLAHELAHIRRADYFWNLLQTVIETLFFFHPAVWYISRRVRQEREFCCDDAVLARCADPSIYASALVRLEQERNASLHFAMALDGHSPSGLRTRILRILGHGEDVRRVRPVSLTAISAAIVLFLCPLPRVFASFREAPKAAAAIIAPAVHHVVHPLLVEPIKPIQQKPTAKPSPATSAATPAPAPEPQANPSPQRDSAETQVHSDYIDRMRAAGYDVDLDKYVAMKVQGITPEYAAQMNKQFGSKLSPDALIGLKIQSVTPEYITAMRAAGYDVPPNKLMAMRIQGVTPEYAAAMAKLGFGTPTADELISLRIQGVTPEDAQKFKEMGVDVHGFQSLITARIFNITPAFIEQMKAAGFDHIPSQKIVALRVQGVNPEFAKSVKAQFPDATVDDLIQMRIFNINDKFIASAKQHGFTPLTIRKLVQLRISGVMDEADDTRP